MTAEMCFMCKIVYYWKESGLWNIVKEGKRQFSSPTGMKFVKVVTVTINLSCRFPSAFIKHSVCWRTHFRLPQVTLFLFIWVKYCVRAGFINLLHKKATVYTILLNYINLAQDKYVLTYNANTASTICVELLDNAK